MALFILAGRYIFGLEEFLDRPVAGASDLVLLAL
jgi:hypothetical protein